MKNAKNVLARKILSERLRAVRGGRNLTQDELASLSNVNRAQIVKFETAVGNPTLDTLVELAMALDVDLNDLMPMSRYRNERSAG